MDPTDRQKNRLINILRSIKSEGRLEDHIYKRIYPTGASSPKLYGLPKIHKKNIPLRPIVSSQGSVSYGVAKDLARILKPLSGNTIHQVNNSQRVCRRHQEDPTGGGRMHHVIWCGCPLYIYPSEACNRGDQEEVGTGYRAPQKNHHVHSKHPRLARVLLVQYLFLVPMSILWANPGGSHGISCELCAGQFMYGDFWGQSPINSSGPPRWWKRFGDDIFVILKQDKKEQFLQYIYSVDQAIQFTIEEQKQDGSMPFLDILVTPQEYGTLTTRVYRKPTHKDQYLQWDSHHNLACK